MAHYVAAKHALVGLTRAAAIELAPFGVRVNCIHPWGVDTLMVAQTPAAELFADNPTYGLSYAQALAHPAMSSPDEIARAVLFLASEDARSVTGAQFPLDRGATIV
jgi:NAD(P)-dependent dehydrogenase (short-subunit alcohol dehydrogenase family)